MTELKLTLLKTWYPFLGDKGKLYSTDPDQLLHNEASDQGLHCLLT